MHTFSKLLLTHCGDRSLPNCLSYTSVAAISLLSPQHIPLCSHIRLKGGQVFLAAVPLWTHISCVACSKPSPCASPCRHPSSESSCIQLATLPGAHCTMSCNSKLCSREDTSAPGGEVSTPLCSGEGCPPLQEGSFLSLPQGRAWPCCHLLTATTGFYRAGTMGQVTFLHYR